MSLDLLGFPDTYFALDPSGEESCERMTLVDVVLPTERHRLVVSVFLSDTFVSRSVVRIDRA